MAFKPLDVLLTPDLRFAGSLVIEGGTARLLTLADHHADLSRITTNDGVPDEVRDAFDRARSVMVYAYFHYELLVVGEMQALAALELALKSRLSSSGVSVRGTLRNVVNKARKVGLLPAMEREGGVLGDPVEWLIYMRNDLAHGSSAIHLPAVAVSVLAACAEWINHVYSSASGTDTDR